MSYRISCSKPGSYEIPETEVFYTDAMGDQYRANLSSLGLKVLKAKFHANMTEIQTAIAERDSNYFNTSASMLVSSVSILTLIYLLLG